MGLDKDFDMFDHGVTLLSPDRVPMSLRDVAGSRGLVVVGVGRGGERGFQMLYRFREDSERLASQGVHLVFAYPRESARHVLDPISASSARLQRRPCLLLDADGCFFRNGPPARSVAVAHIAHDMTLLDAAGIDLRDETWEDGLHAYLSGIRVGANDAAPVGT